MFFCFFSIFIYKVFNIYLWNGLMKSSKMSVNNKILVILVYIGMLFDVGWRCRIFYDKFLKDK